MSNLQHQVIPQSRTWRLPFVSCLGSFVVLCHESSVVFRQMCWRLALFEALVFVIQSKSFGSGAAGIVEGSNWKRLSFQGLRARSYSHLGTV